MMTDTEPNTQYDSPHVDLELQNPDLMVAVTDEFIPPQPWARLVSNHSSIPQTLLMDQPANADGRINSYLLGRSTTCEVKFPDSFRVSNRHCTIFCKYNRVDPSNPVLEVWIEDLSANGTYINKDTRLKKNVPRLLRNADEIFLVNPELTRLSTGAVTEEEIQKNSFVIMINIPSAAKAQARKYTLSRAINEVMATRTSTVVKLLNQNRCLQDHYELKELLGTGTSGRVYLGIHKETGTSWAVKTIDTRKIEAQENLTKEAEMLRSLRHPNIIHLEDIFADDRNIHLIMELSDGGDLFDRISFKGHYGEEDSRIVIRQILEAIKYLHDRKISHRDLKPENILLISKNSDVDVKITDFGLAKRLEDTSGGFKSYCGTPQYFAPEVLQRKNTIQKKGVYSFEADMWSVGVILFVMLSGSFPFNEKVLFQQIKKADYNFNSSVWKKVSLEAKTFIQKLLLVNARERLTADEALQDPWITGGKPSAVSNNLLSDSASYSNGSSQQFDSNSHFSSSYASSNSSYVMNNHNQNSNSNSQFSDSQSPPYQAGKMVPPMPGKKPAAKSNKRSVVAAGGIAAVGGGIDQYFSPLGAKVPGAEFVAAALHEPITVDMTNDEEVKSEAVVGKRASARKVTNINSVKSPTRSKMIYSLDSVPPSCMEVDASSPKPSLIGVLNAETANMCIDGSEEVVSPTSRKRPTRSTTANMANGDASNLNKRKKTK